MTNPNFPAPTPSPTSACPSCAAQSANVLRIGADWWVVSCSDCGLIGPISAKRDQAIDGWNQRLTLASHPAPGRKAIQNA